MSESPCLPDRQDRSHSPCRPLKAGAGYCVFSSSHRPPTSRDWKIVRREGAVEVAGRREGLMPSFSPMADSWHLTSHEGCWLGSWASFVATCVFCVAGSTLKPARCHPRPSFSRRVKAGDLACVRQGIRTQLKETTHTRGRAAGGHREITVLREGLRNSAGSTNLG